MTNENKLIGFRRLLAAALTAFAVVAMAAAPALAADEVDEADAPGEVVIKTNVQFIKFAVNGKSNWDNHHFENRNRTLVIMGLTRGRANTIELMPRQEGLQPQTLTLNDGEFRRKRVRRDRHSVIVFQAKRSLKFIKSKPAAAAKPAPAKPRGKPSKIAPKKKKKKAK